MKTAQTIETAQERESSSQPTRRKAQHGRHPNSLANLRPKPWPKGVSGNPGGKPGYDVAAKIARTILEENQEEIYQGMAQEVIDGKPYAFDVIANRAYGKVKERVEVTGADGEPLNIKITVVNGTQGGT